MFDLADYPLVRLRTQGLPAGYGPDWARQMDALLARGEAFVLLLLDEHGEEAQEDKKVKTAWIKANRQVFTGLCRGFVAVEPNPVRRLALRAQGMVISQAFGLRFAVARDAAAAEDLGRRLLAGTELPDSGE